MPSNLSFPVFVRLSPDQVKVLDDWQRKQKDLPERPEAIRRLMETGLAAPTAKRKPAK
jgi:hypothetical protein